MNTLAAAPYGISSTAPGSTTLLNGGGSLLPPLGSFWDDFVPVGVLNEVSAILDARAELARQEQEDVVAAALTSGLQSTPLLRSVRWQALAISDSVRLADNRLGYISTDSLGAHPTTTASTQTWDYPLPTGFTGVALLTDDGSNPLVAWAYATDFTIDSARNAIRFLSDPLSDPRLAGQVVTDSTGNRSVTLLAFRNTQDNLQLQQRYGAIFKFSGTSTEAFRALLIALNTTYLLGPNREALEIALGALTGTPICAVTGEVVQQIVTDNDRTVIVTDRTVYEGGLAASVVVSIGQALVAGQPLTDGFTVIDPSQGTPTPAVLPSLTLPSSFLTIASGSLTFNNAYTPLLVSTISGRTAVSFALGGAPGDVSAFWSHVHTAGTSGSNKTLAQLLDTRPQPQSTDPDAASLPSVINPLDFLIKNVLRYNALVVVIQNTSMGRWALGTTLLSRVMRTLIAPWQSVFVVTPLAFLLLESGGYVLLEDGLSRIVI